MPSAHANSGPALSQGANAPRSPATLATASASATCTQLDTCPKKPWAWLWYRLSRILGSLPMAVVLLPAFAAVLTLGTVVESSHGSSVAHQLVYETWWFVA